VDQAAEQSTSIAGGSQRAGRLSDDVLRKKERSLIVAFAGESGSPQPAKGFRSRHEATKSRHGVSSPDGNWQSRVRHHPDDAHGDRTRTREQERDPRSHRLDEDASEGDGGDLPRAEQRRNSRRRHDRGAGLGCGGGSGYGGQRSRCRCPPTTNSPTAQPNTGQAAAASTATPVLASARITPGAKA